jgi:hypothetical protein
MDIMIKCKYTQKYIHKYYVVYADIFIHLIYAHMWLKVISFESKKYRTKGDNVHHWRLNTYIDTWDGVIY